MAARRVARVFAWTVAGVLVVTGGLVVALLAINWSDEAPSANSLRLQRVVNERPAVADLDNAYVFVLGIGAPRDEDPFELGRTRKAFLENLPPPRTQGEAFVDFPSPDVDFKTSRSPAIVELADACAKGSTVCAQSLQGDPATVERWIASESWMLDRYMRLMRLRHFRETIPTDSRAPIPRYQYALDGQKHLLMRAWLHARAGEGDAARELLQQDLMFWRMVLRSSDILIAKMIANAAIDRHFSVGNLVLRERQEGGSAIAPPEAWTRPISQEERSMLRTFAGEWIWSSGAIERGVSVDSRVAPTLLRHVYKPQATKNLFAARMVRISDALAVEHQRLPAAARALARLDDENRMLKAYNPVGHYFDREAVFFGYAEYAVRVSDLEGTRRAALLAAALRQADVDATHVVERIGSAVFKDPYTGQAFGWDYASQSIIFNGLEKGPRGQHALLL